MHLPSKKRFLNRYLIPILIVGYIYTLFASINISTINIHSDSLNQPKIVDLQDSIFYETGVLDFELEASLDQEIEITALVVAETNNYEFSFKSYLSK